MRKTLKQLTAILVCLCAYFNLSAQNHDSLWLDLGRVRVKKDFTQSVTIKGKDRFGQAAACSISGSKNYLLASTCTIFSMNSDRFRLLLIIKG